jgi:hypothetical protein
MSVSIKPIHEKLLPTNLGNRGVWFVGSSRADSLVFVVDLCRRPKSSLERPSAVKRAGRIKRLGRGLWRRGNGRRLGSVGKL